MRKIDAHVHIYERINGYGFRGELRPIGDGLGQWANGDLHRLIPKNIGGTAFSGSQLIHMMNENGIERAMILQGNIYGFQNAYIREVVAQYPDRLRAACAVDPFARQGLTILKQFLSDGVFKAAKFEFSDSCGLMSFHDPFALNGERMLPYYAMINEYNAVLVVDIGSLGMDSYQPEAIADIAESFPKMRIVVCHLMAHAAGEDKILEEELKKLDCPNIWFDLAAIPWNISTENYPFPTALRYIRMAADIVGSEKLLWGSDLPGVILETSYRQLADYIEQSEAFTHEEKEQMFSKNAEKVYFT